MRRSKLGVAAVAAALFAAAFAVYWPALDDGLIVYDDEAYVNDARRDAVRRLTWDSVTWALGSFHQGFYAPATWISFMVDASLWHGDPASFHRTNVLLHAANGSLLFLVLVSATGARWRSALAAALFVCHPVHVESVAWVTARKDVLSLFFLLLALVGYVGYRRSPTATRLGLVLLCFLLGLMAKPMIVTLPLLLLAIDFWPLGGAGGMPAAVWREAGARERPWRRRLEEKVPLLVPAGIFAALTYVAHERIYLPPMDPAILLSRAGDAFVHGVHYLQKLVWPRTLSLFYAAPAESYRPGEVLAAATVLAMITTWVVRSTKRTPWLAAGWFWYVAALVPVLQVVKTAEHPVADRFAYVPFIGLYTAIAWAAGGAVRARRIPGAVTISAAAVALVLLAVRAREQVEVWGDQVELFRVAVREAPANMRARLLLGDALAARGDFERAVGEYRAVAAQLPSQVEPYRQMGYALFRLGDLEGALQQFAEAVRIQPDRVENHVNVGTVLLDLGHGPTAVAHFREAVRLQPDDVRALTNLGIALGEMGDGEGARANLLAALSRNPAYGLAHLNLGVLLAREGRFREAEEHFREAIRASPANADAHYMLGRVLEIAGRKAEAEAEYRRTLAIDPRHVQAQAAGRGSVPP